MIAPAAPSRRSIRLPRPATAVAVGLVSLLTLAGCGSARHAAAASGTPDTIDIRNFAFVPSTLQVAPGAEITVHNLDPAVHTLTSSSDPTTAKGFDTGDIRGGATVTFKAPSAAGSYSYICRIHQFMHGTIQVR